MKMNKHRDVTRKPLNVVMCKWSEFIQWTLCQFSSMNKQNKTKKHSNTFKLWPHRHSFNFGVVCQNQTATTWNTNDFFFFFFLILCQDLSSKHALSVLFCFLKTDKREHEKKYLTGTLPWRRLQDGINSNSITHTGSVRGRKCNFSSNQYNTQDACLCEAWRLATF